MRSRRIKVKGQTAVYHCMSRVVGGQKLLDDRAREIFRRQLWQVAGFCGIEIISYCIMPNHFHVLARVPEPGELSDEELLRRYKLLYGRQVRKVAVMEADLHSGSEEGMQVREGLVARMGDVSVFMKELKQRFSIWYNKSQGRYGTLWAERFKSVLVEGRASALRTVAAYIDLNPVRAGLVEDPKDYRFSGYGEALGGSEAAGKGLCHVVEDGRRESALRQYRMLLYGVGGVSARADKAVIGPAEVQAVIKAGGKLPVPVLLRMRVRYFSDGAVLGSREFVHEYFENNRERFGSRRKQSWHSMIGSDWDGLKVIRQLKRKPIG